METNNLILIETFCTNCNIESSFIDSLHEFGLIEVVLLENNRYLAQEQLRDVEKMVRFYYDLNINMEGIDAISNLLKQIDDLQHELKIAKDKLKLHERE